MKGIEIIYHAVTGSRPTEEEVSADPDGWNDVWHFQDEYKRIYDENRVKHPGGFRGAAALAGTEIIRQIIAFRPDLEADPNGK